MAGSSRHVNEPKLFMLAILVGINDYSYMWKKIEIFEMIAIFFF